ncbi:MAG: hypothetical protein WCG83_05100 [Candidatus Peregrinibacteria bacterium]
MAPSALRKRPLSFEPLERRDAPSATPLPVIQNVAIVHDTTAANVGTLLAPTSPAAQSAEGEAAAEEPFSFTALQQQEFDTRSAEVRPLIPALRTARDVAAAKISPLQKSISDATTLIATNTTNLKNAQDAKELLDHPPAYSISVNAMSKTLTLTYENFPKELNMAVKDSYGGTWNRWGVGPGSGTLQVTILNGTSAHVYACMTFDGKNDPIDYSTRTDFTVIRGVIQQSWSVPRQLMTSLTNGVVAPDPAKVTQWQTELTDAQKRLSEGKAALLVAQADAASSEEAFRTALREVIGNPRIEFVSCTPWSDGFILTLRYRSASAETYILVSGSNVLHKENQVHPNGQEDGLVVLKIDSRNSSSNPLTISLYEVNADQEVLVDRLFGAIYRYSVGMEPSRAWSDNETGKLSVNALPFDLSVARIEGPNVLVRFTSPGDETILNAGNGGMFSEEILTHEGGTASGIALLTFGADKPSGIYAITLRDKRNLMERDRVMVGWNATARTLSLQDSKDQYTVAATALPSYSTVNPADPLADRLAHVLSDEARTLRAETTLQMLINQQQKLTTTSMTDTNRSLAQLQASTLYGNSRLYVPYTQVFAAFCKTYPDWDERNLQATVQRMWIEGGKTNTTGAIRDFLLSGIRDQEDRLEQSFRTFEWIMQEITMLAVNVVVGVHQGYPEAPLINALRVRIGNGLNQLGKVGQVGITLPTLDVALAEGKRLYQQELGQMLKFQEDDAWLTRMIHEESQDPNFRRDHNGLSFLGILTDPPPAVLVPSANDARALARAQRLVTEALRRGTDPRAQMTVAIRDDANIQRIRQLANGTTELALTTAEAKGVSGAALGAAADAGGDAGKAGESLDDTLGTMTTKLLLEAKLKAMTPAQQTTFYGGLRDSVISTFNTGIVGGAVVASNGPINDTNIGTVLMKALNTSLIKQLGVSITNSDEFTYLFGLWYCSNPATYFQCINRAKDIVVQNAILRDGYAQSLNDQEGMKKYHESIGSNLLATESLQKIIEAGKASNNGNEASLRLNNIHQDIFLHQEGKPNTAGKLVILILGNVQQLDDPYAGLSTQALEVAHAQGYEILMFRVGDFVEQIASTVYPTFALHPDVVYTHTRNVIEDRIKGRGMFQGLPPIKEVVGMAYSWGGGTADKLFGTAPSAKALLGSATLKGMAYIDAVKLGITGLGLPVTQKPAAQSFYNAYQKHTIPIQPSMVQGAITIYNVLTTGAPVHGVAISGAKAQKNWGLTTDHVNIDELETRPLTGAGINTNALSIFGTFSK